MYCVIVPTPPTPLQGTVKMMQEIHVLAAGCSASLHAGFEAIEKQPPTGAKRTTEAGSNGFGNLVSNYNSRLSDDDFIFDMLTSLPDSPVYKSMPMSSHCNYISRKDVGGNKAPTNTIVFPFN